jgi:plastocyanin
MLTRRSSWPSPGLIGVAFVGLFLAVAGPSALAAAEEPIVLITDTLEPSILQVEPGTTVTWRNEDSERHRVRSREGPEPFDSGNLEAGETFTFTFALEGSYPYLDERDDDDPAYYGTVVVGGSSGTQVPLPETGDVSIFDRTFRPPSIAIVAGGSVTWTNDDGEAHTVTSTDGAFDSDIVAGGAAFTQAFPDLGTYAYFCAIHPDMRGTVVVSASDPAASAAAPVPTAGPSETPTASLSETPTASPSVSPSAPASPGAAGTAIAATIIDRAFEPPDLEVAAGGTVTWVNDDTEGHTVTALDGSFDSGVITVGGEFPATFESPGTFDYFCAIHPEMTGTVTVTGLPPASSPAPSAAPSAAPAG